MRSSHSLDALSVQFDDDNSAADSGLILPATLSQHIGLRELFYEHVNLGDAPGRANVGDKAMTLIASLIAGGECIDDADALHAGETEKVLGHWVAAPSTLGTFLRSFSFGHARQLDVVSGELLERAWGSGAGPDSDEPVTIDLDSTICETYGLKSRAGPSSPLPLAQAGKTREVMRLEHKALVDRVKISAYNAEEWMLDRIIRHCPNTNDARDLLRSFAELSGEVRSTAGGVVVTLDPPDTPMHRRALQGLCDELNEARAVFPGTDLPVSYRVAMHNSQAAA